MKRSKITKTTRTTYRSSRKGINFMRKPKRFAYTRSKQGFLKLDRKCGQVTVRNSGTVGTYSYVDSNASNAFVWGTAVSNQMGNGYDIPFVGRFCLSQILNSSDITNLCDSYMLKKTVIRVYFNSNTNSIGSAYNLPTITYAVDHDDFNVPTVNFVREKMGCKIKYFNSSTNFCKITLYPKIQQATLQAGGQVLALPNQKATWINSEYPNVDHYAIKGVLQNVPLPVNTAGISVGFSFDITHTVYAKDFQ